MATRRNKTSKKKYGNKKKTMRKKHMGKKWITAVEAAKTEYKKTGSITKAKQTLNKQALVNARKLFGSIGEKM
jgi:hypothetical protein